MIKDSIRLISLFTLLLVHQTSLCMRNSLACIGDSFKGNSHDDRLGYDSRINSNFKDPDVRKFLKEFSPPKGLLGDLLQKKDINITDESINHPDFMGKSRYVLSRTICAKRLQNMIVENGYTRVAVPNKYLFLTNSNQSSNRACISPKKFLLCYSEKVTATKDKEVTIHLQQMKEFADVVLKTRFCDAHTWNFIIDEQKRIVFIDTDIESFSHGGRWESHNLEKLWKFLDLGKNKDIFTDEENNKIYESCDSCKMHDVVVKVSDDAKNYLSRLIQIHQQSLNSTCRSFTQKSEYDSKDLKVAYVAPQINSWIYEQNNMCKRDFESRWCYSYLPSGNPFLGE